MEQAQTTDPVDAIPVDQLAALVAKEVMAWTLRGQVYCGTHSDTEWEPAWHPESDPRDTNRVIERMNALGFWCELNYWPNLGDRKRCGCYFSVLDQDSTMLASYAWNDADTMGTAVCRAAIAAVRVKQAREGGEG